MKDFVRFLLRGAWGSAMAGATLTLLIVLYYFGPSWGVMYLFHPFALFFFAVPGACVGFVLWFITALIGTHLITILRITIGMGVLLTIYFAIVLYLLGGHVDQITLTDSTLVVWLLLWLAFTGGIAGLACPSRKLFTKEAGLTYGERMALYEIAQLEASIAGKEYAHSIGR
jgi:hypothetical protein